MKLFFAFGLPSIVTVVFLLLFPLIVGNGLGADTPSSILARRMGVVAVPLLGMLSGLPFLLPLVKSDVKANRKFIYVYVAMCVLIIQILFRFREQLLILGGFKSN